MRGLLSAISNAGMAIIVSFQFYNQKLQFLENCLYLKAEFAAADFGQMLLHSFRVFDLFLFLQILKCDIPIFIVLELTFFSIPLISKGGMLLHSCCVPIAY